jgi:nitrite reductase/ring-hydroxylating ferredoxin subunit
VNFENYLYNKKLMKNRRDFLKTTCPTVAFAIFGVTLLQACSASEDPMYEISTGNNNTPVNNNTAGLTVNGNNFSIDLANSNFSKLAPVGGWLNLTSAGLLLLRVNENTIRAFDNCCPHQGTKTQWSYNSNVFNCANHGNNFGIDSNTKNCDSGATSGDLKSFSASISGETLTVIKD